MAHQSHPYGLRQPPSLFHIIHAIIAVGMPEDVLRDTNAPFSTSATPLDEGNKILCAVLLNHRQKKSLKFLQRRVIGDGCLPSFLSSFLSGMEDAHSATGWNLRVRRHKCLHLVHNQRARCAHAAHSVSSTSRVIMCDADTQMAFVVKSPY